MSEMARNEGTTSGPNRGAHDYQGTQGAGARGSATGGPVASRPNILLFLPDAMQQQVTEPDHDCQTPNFDRLASRGVRFTRAHTVLPTCSPARASLMTGCYANRVSMSGALNHTSRTGIHPNEVLLPEICKSRGYATAIFGKWHLGTLAEFGPLRNGFDQYLGIPYSNDNSKYHPIIRDMPPLPLYDGERSSRPTRTSRSSRGGSPNGRCVSSRRTRAVRSFSTCRT